MANDESNKGISANTLSAKIKIALYLRVSTQEQATEGYSIEAQEQSGREFAKRMNYEVVSVYKDEGVSGKSTKNRKAYQRMMEAAKEGEFELLVIWKLTRLGRNMLDILKTVETLLKYDVGLYSISEQFDVTTSSGKLMLQLLGSFGEFERNQISENVQMAMKSLVRDQKRYAGGRRLGYVSDIDADGKKYLRIEPDEARIVQMIFKQYIGGNGYRAIANQLNRQGYKTVKGNDFSTLAVKDILKNKVYGGYLEYAKYVDWDTKRRRGKNPNPILVKGEHEPIIDQEIYELVQERLKAESKQPQWNNTGENLLTGLLRCPVCDAPMAASNVTNTLKDGTKKRIRYYSCSNFRNKGASVCSANSIRADKAEEFVADRLKEIVQVPQILKKLVDDLNREMKKQVMPIQRELETVRKKKEELDQNLKKWHDVLLDNPEIYDSIKDQLLEREKNRASLQISENELLSFLKHKDEVVDFKDVQKILTGIDTMLTDKPKSEIKKIYRAFINKITFDNQTKENIQITVKFNQEIVSQLNEIYQKALPADSNAGKAYFVMQKSMQLLL